MDREDQGVADYSEGGNYGDDNGISDNAPDTRLDRPQFVIVPRGSRSGINRRQSQILTTFTHSPFAQHDHIVHFGDILVRRPHRTVRLVLVHSRREISTHFPRAREFPSFRPG